MGDNLGAEVFDAVSDSGSPGREGVESSFSQLSLLPKWVLICLDLEADQIRLGLWERRSFSYDEGNRRRHGVNREKVDGSL